MHITQVVLVLQTIGMLIAAGKLIEAGELTNTQLAVAQAQEADYEAWLEAQMASDEGIFAAPEGAACVDAAARLLRSRFLKSTDRIVIYNTGSGLKYPEAYSTRFPMATAGEQDKLGGLITPR